MILLMDACSQQLVLVEMEMTSLGNAKFYQFRVTTNDYKL